MVAERSRGADTGLDPVNPMPLTPAQRAFWDGFLASRGGQAGGRFFECFHFDDNAPSADELAALVRAGIKRATAGLLWSFENAGMPLPRAGDLSIVTDFAGTPCCVIQTHRVSLVPFEDVSAEFAATEGEGDGSLRYWREAHGAYFGRECARINRQPDPRMPVVCEEFAVVYAPG